MRFHIGNAMVVKNAALAMASLAESDEVSALKVFKDPGSVANDDLAADAGSSDGGGQVAVSGAASSATTDVEAALVAAEAALKTVKGIPIILKAYEIHKDNAEVRYTLFFLKC